MIINNQAQGQSIFKRIREAKIYDRGRFLEPNFRGIVRIVRTVYKQTRAKGLAFIVEFEIEESNVPDIVPVGDKRSWYRGLNDEDIALSAILEWGAACAGFHKHQKAEIENLQRDPDFEEALNRAAAQPDDNPFIGIRLRLATVPITTLKGNPFTIYEFSPLSA